MSSRIWDEMPGNASATYSENQSPEEVVSILNEYPGKMTGITPSTSFQATSSENNVFKVFEGKLTIIDPFT